MSHKLQHDFILFGNCRSRVLVIEILFVVKSYVGLQGFLPEAQRDASGQPVSFGVVGLKIARLIFVALAMIRHVVVSSKE